MPFDKHSVLEKLHHYLPHQNPLKDFIHHNTLGAFQDKDFHTACMEASCLFGYKTYQNISQYRSLYKEGRINPSILDWVIQKSVPEKEAEAWKTKVIEGFYQDTWQGRTGKLHEIWSDKYHINLLKKVHNKIFRLLSSYIDQGVSMWSFPTQKSGFLDSIRELETHTAIDFFKTKRVKSLLFDPSLSLTQLLDILVGDSKWYEDYLFDIAFSHPGWAGMVCVLEKHPERLLQPRKITLEEVLLVELLLEIDKLDSKHGVNQWKPLKEIIDSSYTPLFSPIENKEIFKVYAIWQESYEWSYYDQFLKGLEFAKKTFAEKIPDLQTIHCIDDRSCSIRRYLEKLANAQTFGTAGFFNFEFYYQAQNSKFYSKSCPMPIQPKYLIQEKEASKHHHNTDIHLGKYNRGLVLGGVTAQFTGLFAALKLVKNIFKPSETSIAVSASTHMHQDSTLTFEYTGEHKDGLQIGFTHLEMADRLEELLKSIGLTKNFADLIYIIGHGSSSVNNTYYAGYDCGACSGRPGSVNARVAAYAANLKEVRAILHERGIKIPETTHFVSALHDTTRDEIYFYDEETIPSTLQEKHKKNMAIFNDALDRNAKERARRFINQGNKASKDKVHEKIKMRSYALFEPRPEWNHATNALCIVGRREIHEHLFLDRRAFLNSYDYRNDLNGELLTNLIKAITPVCGGINLEYYFSKMDNHKLGAGSKLPHNVIALIGVGNGTEGDLRTGLPSQMLNIHESIRLLMAIEHYPDIIHKAINNDNKTYQWYHNNWIHLVAIEPETYSLYRYDKGSWISYIPFTKNLPVTQRIEPIIENYSQTLPVYLIQK